MEKAEQNTMKTPSILKYDNYKDSRVEWLGEIPEHWDVKRFKHVFTEKKKTTNVALNCGSISFGKVVYKDDEKIPEATKRSYQVLSKGDFLINPLNLNYDLISLRIALSDKEVVVSSGYIVLKNTIEIDKDYYKWLLHIFDILFMKTLGSGVRQTLSFTHIADSDLVLPPLPEQTAIANFLDKKTALIEQAIGIKEKQIELLKERRQILIHQAVTKGLDKTVKLKDSGVEWIGEIPENWGIKKLKYCLFGKLKYGANESGILYDVKLPRYVRITDFGQDGKLSEESKLSLNWKQGINYLLKDGDILFARSGGTVGKTYLFKKSMSIEENYCYAGYLIKAESNDGIILSDFLYLYTISDLFNSWKDSIFIKATIENIGADKYSQLPVILPTIQEQKQILSKFRIDDSKLSIAISLKEKEIEKLKEYKASLINSAVTGKFKIC